MNKERIKIYGERNSGTNYLEKLIALNLDVELIKFEPSVWTLFLFRNFKYGFLRDWVWSWQTEKVLGWKHACPPTKEIKNYNETELVILTITKNPYSFLNSLYKRPYHIKGVKADGFSNFIKQGWKTIGRDQCHQKYLSSPIELWNIKNRSYLDLKATSHKSVINISYEELLRNPALCMKSISDQSGIALKNDGSFKNHLTSTKQTESTFESYRTYYLNEIWRNEFTQPDIEWINNRLDQRVLDHFDYVKILKL